ncbi:MAG: terminase small subunit, partial [Oscillospiraceae bacterium]|nr:terminase small subunit [Oscillospiraceae bacterium]
MNKISLNEKERLFCRYYADFLNPKEAALKAGYSP